MCCRDLYIYMPQALFSYFLNTFAPLWLCLHFAAPLRHPLQQLSVSDRRARRLGPGDKLQHLPVDCLEVEHLLQLPRSGRRRAEACSALAQRRHRDHLLEALAVLVVLRSQRHLHSARLLPSSNLNSHNFNSSSHNHSSRWEGHSFSRSREWST